MKSALAFLLAPLAVNAFGGMPMTGKLHGEPNAPHTSVEWQTWAYSTAAPTELGSAATIMDGSMAVLRQGTNGWSCMPANPRGMADPENGWADPHEAMPVCFDSAGMDWMKGWMSGSTPEMTRPAILWMLHGDMGEDNSKPGVLKEEDATEGQWIESGPHVMLMPVKGSDLDSFTDDFTTGEPYVMFKGSVYAHLMIPTEGYLQYHN